MTGPSRPKIVRRNYEIPSSYRAGPTGPVNRPEGPYNYKQPPFREGLEFQRFTQVGKPQKLSRWQNWYMRNPRKLHAVGLTIGLSIFFSRPIYDIFFRKYTEAPLPLKSNRLKSNI